MKAASKYILKYFVVGVVTCLSLLFLSCPVKASTSDNFAGHWYVWEENVNVSGNQWISYQNVLIVTNDPLAMGQVQVNNTTSGLNNFVQTLDFSGTYTFYSHRFEQPYVLQNGLMPVATSNGRAFTSYTPILSYNNIEIVELSSSQINSLINSIQASSSYDDTDLLNRLAIINGVLDNIDTSSSATASSIAALNTTATSILNAINNIDTALDIISWDRINVNPLGASNDGVNFTSNTGSRDNSYKYYIDDIIINDFTNDILKIRIPVTVNLNGTLKVTNNALNNVYYNLSLVQYGRYYTDIYLILNESRYSSTSATINGTRKFVIEFSGQWSITSTNLVANFGVFKLGNNDIEFWQLKTFFEIHKQNESDTSAIDNENQDLSDQVDDYIQQENQLIGGFDNAMTNPAVIPTSNPDANLGSWGSNFISSLSLFSVLVGNVVGTSLTQWGNPIYLLLNFSLVFGFALLIIGKRG